MKDVLITCPSFCPRKTRKSRKKSSGSGFFIIFQRLFSCVLFVRAFRAFRGHSFSFMRLPASPINAKASLENLPTLSILNGFVCGIPRQFFRFYFINATLSISMSMNISMNKTKMAGAMCLGSKNSLRNIHQGFRLFMSCKPHGY